MAELTLQDGTVIDTEKNEIVRFPDPQTRQIKEQLDEIVYRLVTIERLLNGK